MSILTTRRFGLWWSLAMSWFDTKFNTIIAALPSEASESEIDSIFVEQTNSTSNNGIN